MFRDKGTVRAVLLQFARVKVVLHVVEIAAALEAQLNSSQSSFELSSLNRKPASNVYRHFFDIVAERLHVGSQLAIALIASSPRSALLMRIIGLLGMRAGMASVCDMV